MADLKPNQLSRDWPPPSACPQQRRPSARTKRLNSSDCRARRSSRSRRERGAFACTNSKASTHHYGISVNALLRREAVHTDLIPRFRKLFETDDDHTAEAVRLMNDLVKTEVELENLLGIERPRNYPPERGIVTGDVTALAEQHAQDLRNWLGPGLGPDSRHFFSLIELDLSIRLYQRRLSSRSKVAGLFAYDDAIGACILLNANHPLERRIQSAVHELGHFVGTRHVPEVLEENGQFLSRDERYAKRVRPGIPDAGKELSAEIPPTNGWFGKAHATACHSSRPPTPHFT